MTQFSKDRKDYSPWQDYIELCGSVRIKANEFRTDNVFNGRFRDTKVTWEGYVYGTDPISRGGNIMKGLRIKMDPTDSQDFDILLLSSDSLNGVIASVKEGDYVKFHGTLKFIGNEEYPHIVDTSSIELPTKRLEADQLKSIPQYQFKKTGRMFGGKSL